VLLLNNLKQPTVADCVLELAKPNDSEGTQPNPVVWNQKHNPLADQMKKSEKSQGVFTPPFVGKWP
jgi:hypothetical protein